MTTTTRSVCDSEARGSRLNDHPPDPSSFRLPPPSKRFGKTSLRTETSHDRYFSGGGNERTSFSEGLRVPTPNVLRDSNGTSKRWDYVPLTSVDFRHTTDRILGVERILSGCKVVVDVRSKKLCHQVKGFGIYNVGRCTSLYVELSLER